MKKDYDIKFMNYAINLARKNSGATGKNPAVGCVITYKNQIIATGITEKGGRPHAEKMAIDKVNNKEILKESTLYISLEPCSCNNHGGITCCDYIIENKIPRVVVATIDPNPEINGRSLEKLKKHNVNVISGVLSDKADEGCHFFKYSQKKQKPFVTLKIATSIDGKIATMNHDSKWITSKSAREYSHFLRATHDGILVGGKTARIDNPQLNCRIKSLETYSPKIFILSKEMNFSHDLQIFKQKNSEIYLVSPISSQNIDRFEKIRLSNPHIKHIAFKNNHEYLDKIYKTGIKSLLVEGGSSIATQLLKDDQIDRIIWISSKKIIGNDGLSAIGNLNIKKIEQAIDNYKITKCKNLGDEFIRILSKH